MATETFKCTLTHPENVRITRIRIDEIEYDEDQEIYTDVIQNADGTLTLVVKFKINVTQNRVKVDIKATANILGVHGLVKFNIEYKDKKLFTPDEEFSIQSTGRGSYYDTVSLKTA